VTNPFLNPETVKLMRGVVKIPANQRSEPALKVISDILKVTPILFPKTTKQGNFLKKFPSQETLRNIASELAYELHPRDNLLFLQGSTGDKFYIILSGKVNGYMSSPNTRNAQNQPSPENPAFTLGPGMAFGEGALLLSPSRSASITTISDTEFLVLTRASYQRLVGKYKAETIQEFSTVYNESIFLRGISLYVKNQLAVKSFLVKYPADTVVLRQGELPMNLYFIKRGQVKIIR
jgi:CRP-like cAMP-binding protein